MLTALRRQQLVDLARAYDISVPEGATKKEMLPPMIAAEQRGVFKQQPRNPWYLKKAHRTSDIPYVDIGENPETEPEAPKVLGKRKESDYHRKQKALKAVGVNAFGMSKQGVDELAAEHGIE